MKSFNDFFYRGSFLYFFQRTNDKKDKTKVFRNKDEI